MPKAKLSKEFVAERNQMQALWLNGDMSKKLVSVLFRQHWVCAPREFYPLQHDGWVNKATANGSLHVRFDRFNDNAELVDDPMPEQLPPHTTRWNITKSATRILPNLVADTVDFEWHKTNVSFKWRMWCPICDCWLFSCQIAGLQLWPEIGDDYPEVIRGIRDWHRPLEYGENGKDLTKECQRVVVVRRYNGSVDYSKVRQMFSAAGVFIVAEEAVTEHKIGPATQEPIYNSYPTNAKKFLAVLEADCTARQRKQEMLEAEEAGTTSPMAGSKLNKKGVIYQMRKQVYGAQGGEPVPPVPPAPPTPTGAGGLRNRLLKRIADR